MALDAAQCLDAGECLVITNTQYYVFIGVFVVMGIFLFMLFMVGFFTPAMIFLKAKLKKAVLIYSVNRGGVGQFLVGTGKFQGIADVAKIGPFIITENSHTLEKKSKTPMYFAFGEFAATLPLNFAQLVQRLRKRGYKITNISDLSQLAGMKFDNDKKTWTMDEDATDQQKQITKELEIDIRPYQTIKIHDLANMFPFNITPALIESKTQHMIGLKQFMFNKMTPQFVMMFLMIMIGTSLAAIILWKFMGPGATPQAIQGGTTIIERVVQVQNLTG